MDKCPAAHQPRSTRSPKLSPLALRRKYLPRGGNNSLHTAAHQTAAAAAAQNQKQPPQAHQPPKKQTETPATTIRITRLTRFKEGFERETENQLAKAFNRPPRLFKEDTPFYPWLPRPEPRVNFHLNFKF